LNSIYHARTRKTPDEYDPIYKAPVYDDINEGEQRLLNEVKYEKYLHREIAEYCNELVNATNLSIHAFAYKMQISYQRIYGIQVSTFYISLIAQSITSGELNVKKFQNTDAENKKALQELSEFMYPLGVDKNHELVHKIKKYYVDQFEYPPTRSTSKQS